MLTPEERRDLQRLAVEGRATLMQLAELRADTAERDERDKASAMFISAPRARYLSEPGGVVIGAQSLY